MNFVIEREDGCLLNKKSNWVLVENTKQLEECLFKANSAFNRRIVRGIAERVGGTVREEEEWLKSGGIDSLQDVQQQVTSELSRDKPGSEDHNFPNRH